MGPPHRWEEAYRALSGRTEDLDAPSWERLAVAGYMIGEDDTSGAAWEAAHHRYLAGDRAEAARCVVLDGLRSHDARPHGAGQRLAAPDRRIVEESGLDCAAAGYLLIPALLGALGGGDPSSARDMALQARTIATRVGARTCAPSARSGTASPFSPSDRSTRAWPSSTRSWCR